MRSYTRFRAPWLVHGLMLLGSAGCGDAEPTSDDSTDAAVVPGSGTDAATTTPTATAPSATTPMVSTDPPVTGGTGSTQDPQDGVNTQPSMPTAQGGAGGTPEGTDPVGIQGGASGAGGTTTMGGGGAADDPMTTGGAAGAPVATGGGPAIPASGCGQEAPTGTFQGTITAFGLERGYFMSVPESYDPTLPNRLFFGYHGSGWNGQMMRGYLELEEPPLLEGSIFVYPDGLPRGDDPDGVTEWELDPDGRDIAFFDALYAELTSTYCIDVERVFVNGQSFGGMMTNAVGCARGDVVRAIGVVAGSGPRGSNCQGQVAAWLTHGEDDDAVRFSSGEASRDHWVEANGCDATTTAGDPAQCQNYDGCDEGYPVIWCPHVDDGGHQHPSFGREAVRQFFASF